MIPGEMQVRARRDRTQRRPRRPSRWVANTGDRPIQVGSHYHFFETNAALASTARRRAASA
jgi:urease subunit beta